MKAFVNVTSKQEIIQAIKEKLIAYWFAETSPMTKPSWASGMTVVLLRSEKNMVLFNEIETGEIITIHHLGVVVKGRICTIRGDVFMDGSCTKEVYLQTTIAFSDRVEAPL